MFSRVLAKFLQNNSLEHDVCIFTQLIPPESFFAMLLPLVCAFLQYNKPTDCLCEVSLWQFYKISCAKTFLLKSFFVFVLAAMIYDVLFQAHTVFPLTLEEELHPSEEMPFL